LSAARAETAFARKDNIMAATNQRNRSGGQGSNSGKRSSEQGGLGQGAKDKAQQAISQVGEQVSNVRDGMANYLSQGNEQFARMTRGHEGQAAAIALAAGFGIGLVIGCALASGNRRPQTWHERVMAEGIGRKFLDRMEQMLPEAITEHFGR
jgi:hypothetical protein